MFGNDRFLSSRERHTVVPIENEVLVYGASWCGMTQMIRRYLDRMDIPFRYIDMEDDPDAAKQLRWITGGYAGIPTVIIDGQALIQPSVEEVGRSLARRIQD
jgi:mycoredoxin